MNILSRLIHDGSEFGEWRLFCVRIKIPITQLIFADDLILFEECEEGTLETVQKTMAIFMDCSRQKVNYEKTKLYVSPNITLECINLAENTLGVKSSKDLGMYLGFLLSPNRPKKKDVEYIVNKVKGKLTK